VTTINVSIENIKSEEIPGDISVRSSKKNVFRVAADVAGCSIKSLD
jgi:hypothetical protein